MESSKSSNSFTYVGLTRYTAQEDGIGDLGKFVGLGSRRNSTAVPITGDVFKRQSRMGVKRPTSERTDRLYKYMNLLAGHKSKSRSEQNRETESAGTEQKTGLRGVPNA
jgi:hypothetical protein